MSVKFRVKKCRICGGQVRIVNLPKVIRYRDDVELVVFGDVPAQECVECGERFFPSEVALAMDKVIRERVKAQQTIELPHFPMREWAVSK